MKASDVHFEVNEKDVHADIDWTGCFTTYTFLRHIN